MAETRLYDARTAPPSRLADCEAAVGKRGELRLTGRFIKAGESTAGPYVMFEVDERWGLSPGSRFGMDLECFVVEEDTDA